MANDKEKAKEAQSHLAALVNAIPRERRPEVAESLAAVEKVLESAARAARAAGAKAGSEAEG